MDGGLALELLAILVLILANGFFALSEFSVIASRSSKLKQLEDADKSGAAAAHKLHHSPDRFLAAVQVGITLFGTVAGVFGGATIVRKLTVWIGELPFESIAGAANGISVVVVSLAITATSVVIGELVPKYLALSNPEKFARVVSPPMSGFTTITAIFSRALSNTARLIVRMLGVRRDTERSAITEDEINMMIFEGREKGVFDETEHELIRSVFDFADSTVRRSMTPRTEMIAIPIDASADEIMTTITQNGFSRYPVFEKSPDNVVGVLYIKDLIYRQISPKLIVLKDLIRKPNFIPDSMPLAKLLRDMQRTKNQMAIVLDEFGGTAGVITIEDILEELVGQIQDEYDKESRSIVRHSDTTVFVDGYIWPGEINESIGCHLPEDRADTIAGLVIDTLGRMPEDDETIAIADTVVEVLEREENRLTRLKIELTPPTQQD